MTTNTRAIILVRCSTCARTTTPASNAPTHESMRKHSPRDAHMRCPHDAWQKLLGRRWRRRRWRWCRWCRRQCRRHHHLQVLRNTASAHHQRCACNIGRGDVGIGMWVRGHTCSRTAVLAGEEDPPRPAVRPGPIHGMGRAVRLQAHPLTGPVRCSQRRRANRPRTFVARPAQQTHAMRSCRSREEASATG
jgi:hypothetical protein